MVDLAYGLLSLAVLLAGILVAIVAASDPGNLGPLGITGDLRKPARWCYVVTAILSFVISMDMPRKYQRVDALLWLVPVNIVFEGALWPISLAIRIAPKGWWRSREY